jgi:hypothetical protein
MDRLPVEAEGKQQFRLKAGFAFSRAVQATILIFVFFCFTVPFCIQSLGKADALQPSWSSAEIWIQSAECARTTGAILAICKDGKLVPIADVSAGDDPGQALALDLYSILTQKTAMQNDVSRLNSILNYAGIALLAACLFCLRLPVASFLVLTGGALIANQFHSLGPHPGQFGVACFVTVLPLSILAYAFGTMSGRAAWLWLPIGFLGIGIAMMFREAIGLMGVAAGFLAIGIGYFSSIPRTPRRAVVSLGLAVALVLSMSTPEMVFRARDRLYDLPPSTRMEQHGVWHNLYIGLGAVQNSFGIEWNDAKGIEAVRKIDPSIVYLSNEYFAVLRREYFRLLMSHPFEVGRVYVDKLAIAVNVYAAWVGALIVLGVAIFMRIRRKIVGRWRMSELLLFVCGCFVMMFWAQAALFNFTTLYLFPIKLFLLLSFGGLLDSWISSACPSATKSDRPSTMAGLAT